MATTNLTLVGAARLGEFAAEITSTGLTSRLRLWPKSHGDNATIMDFPTAHLHELAALIDRALAGSPPTGAR
jgi:hypothetical protein